MFARTKKSGKYEYLQVVENRREGPKVNQHVIATLGRLDQMHAKGKVETLIRSLARFSEKPLLILFGRSDITAECTSIGPTPIFRTAVGRSWDFFRQCSHTGQHRVNSQLFISSRRPTGPDIFRPLK